MSIEQFFRRLFVETSKQQPKKPTKRFHQGKTTPKLFIVRKEGRQKSYRVNKYGEIFEE